MNQSLEIEFHSKVSVTIHRRNFSPKVLHSEDQGSTSSQGRKVKNGDLCINIPLTSSGQLTSNQ